MDGLLHLTLLRNTTLFEAIACLLSVGSDRIVALDCGARLIPTHPLCPLTFPEHKMQRQY
jgi:hypothetical protein